MTNVSRPNDIPPPPLAKTLRWLSPLYLALGLCSSGLGILGMFIPVLPTTVFFVVAFWAFSKSSTRLQAWLWRHPLIGPTLQAWQRYGVIPVKGKVAAVTVMALSLVVICLEAQSWRMPAISAAIMVPVALWIVTRRSVPPANDETISQPQSF